VGNRDGNNVGCVVGAAVGLFEGDNLLYLRTQNEIWVVWKGQGRERGTGVTGDIYTRL
jgi:hypothetical protein